MRPFLINLKLIYDHGISHSKNKSKISQLFAIHNLHYVTEQIIREKAKDMEFQDALHKIGFVEIIRGVNSRQNIPDYNRLLELNVIRNTAEHLFVIPDSDTIKFYGRIVGDFLKWSFKQYFDIDYDSLALENLIYDTHIRKAMLEAKNSIEKNDLIASNKMYEARALHTFYDYAGVQILKRFGPVIKRTIHNISQGSSGAYCHIIPRSV